MPKYTISQRLKQIMNERNLKQIDIIRLTEPYCNKFKTRIGRNDLSQYLSGKIEPRQNKIYILARALDVNEAWLMGFDVPKERESTEPITTLPRQTDKHLPPIQQNILSICKQLNDKGQNKVLDFCNDLLGNPTYSATGREPGYRIAAYGADETEEDYQPPIEEITT